MRHSAKVWGILALALGSAGCASDPSARPRDPMYGDRIPPVETQPRPANLAAEPTGADLPPVNRPVRGDHRLAIDGLPAGTKAGNSNVANSLSELNTREANAARRGAPRWDQVRRQLRERGVDWQHLEQRDGLWRFQCSVPRPGNPNISRQYEASAADELSAIQAVLEQIDSDR